MKKLLLVIVSAILLSACSLTKTSSTPNYQISDIKINPTNMDNSTPTQTPLAENITAVIKTNKGTMKVALFPKIAPNTVRNFVELAKGTRINPLTGKKVSDKPFYDGVIFHRVIEGFMIQGGDPLGSGMGGPGYKFADEPVTEEYSRGTIAMANSGPNTNGSQFFIMHKDYPLPPSYTIFGRIDPKDAESLATVDAIATTSVNGSDKPLEDVIIQSIVIEEE
ncbi:MAG: Peptidyl-prolyl cis-trans isomerase [Candidatus Collierbacteria bacterium GW2011_GWA2_42_17]|uniref:Peptidyl-prolyl cis-trans isomerase n=1 Tax=Candidatus Collierbacteria bacterium GW2011_GWA2_42_17 TaxID=1618378 RepID=A0A0G0Z1S0_9BACT|nr:MAG: Peptidyl-prolyl cis-trans isomerase [Candidatus Collierbacteria bacterium GW2011_GWB2_42_12]KKS42704.1 MAG: Peptidyl-prolyl cis-trans isomerase [Candidatus Collierbacteria bacterium GW2011_GWA2_42_17]